MPRLTLSNSEKTVLVDEGDVALLSPYRWRLHSQGYAYAVRDGQAVMMHRLLLGLGPGDKMVADHINHDRLDNRRSNLRVATYQENARYRSRPGGRTSRYRGVHFYSRYGKWTAQVKVNGRLKHLGYFATEQEAAMAYDLAAQAAYGEFFSPNLGPA